MGALVVVAVLIAVIMLVRWKHRTGNLQMTFTNVDNKNYSPQYTTAEPLYSKVKRSSPPPPTLPKRLYFTDTTERSGYLELMDMNNKHNLTSTPAVPDPMPSKLTFQPYSLTNPSYTPTYRLDRTVKGSVPSQDMANSQGQAMLNIYPESSPLRSNRPSSPPSHPAPIYSESITPSHFREDRSVSPTDTELHPYAPIYNDPQPLKRSEGPMEVTAQQIREKRNLGVGQFGQVVLAETIGLSLNDLKLSTSNDDKSISILVALKKLKPNAERSVKEAFAKEIKFMSRLNNDNVVRLLGICSSGDPFIIMEYMENGDLNQYLRKFEIVPLEAPPGENQLPPSTLLYMALQIAMGLQCLASLRFVHRDVATRNCLVGANYLVKIADFGMSRILYSSDYYRIRGRAMLPIRWMANECFYGQFTEKTDVWAFGVTMWEIFTFAKKQPYERMSDQEVIDNSVKGPDRQLLPRPEDCPPEVYKVMLRCWVHEPSKRADFEETQSSLAALHAYSDIP